MFDVQGFRKTICLIFLRAHLDYYPPYSQKCPIWLIKCHVHLVSRPWLYCLRSCGASSPTGWCPQFWGTNDHISLSSPFFQPQGTLCLHRPNCYQMLASSLHARWILCWLWRIYSGTISNLFNVQRLHLFIFSVLSRFPEFILVIQSSLSQESCQRIPVKTLCPFWKRYDHFIIAEPVCKEASYQGAF